MVLVDTSVWVEIFRDAEGRRRHALKAAVDEDEVVLSRFGQLELLQGCRDEKEWKLLKAYLDSQEYLELSPASWEEAARIHFDLRRRGRTVRSPIGCGIAQVALDHDAMLLHRDHDFETIAEIRPLRQLFLKWI